MKLIVWPSDSSVSVDDEIGNGLPPPLIPSSVPYGLIMSYTSIAHINSHLYLRPILKKPSRLWPLDWYQISVFYHRKICIYLSQFFSISNLRWLLLSIIHNAPILLSTTCRKKGVKI